MPLQLTAAPLRPSLSGRAPVYWCTAALRSSARTTAPTCGCSPSPTPPGGSCASTTALAGRESATQRPPASLPPSHAHPSCGDCRRWRFATATSGDKLWLFGGHRLWHGFHPRNSVDNDWAFTDEDFPLGGYMNDLWSMDLSASTPCTPRGQRAPHRPPSHRHGHVDAALRGDRVPRRLLPRPTVGEAAEQLMLPGAPSTSSSPLCCVPSSHPHCSRPHRCGRSAAPPPPWPRPGTRSTCTRATAPCSPTPTPAARARRRA